MIIKFLMKWHGIIRIIVLVLFGMWLSISGISIFSWQFWAGLILFLVYGIVHMLGYTEEFMKKKE